MTAAPARGSHAARALGAGSPPPALQRWVISYGTGFMLLALMAATAPELAASLAMLTVTGTLLTNGTSIAADLAHLNADQPATPHGGAADYPVKGGAGAGQ